MAYHIAILFHERNNHRNVRTYSITGCARLWRRQGHRVDFLFGTDHFIAADICIVNVDLSRVPQRYLDFASRYPVMANGRVTDISKSRTSRILLQPDSDWRGPVIVKSDLNCGGWPEKRLSRAWPYHAARRVFRQVSGIGSSMYGSHHYRILGSIKEVPREVWTDSALVVEKFLPERHGDGYACRVSLFMGDVSRSWYRVGRQAVVKNQGVYHREPIAMPPEIERMRDEYHLDIGKIDYCEHDGEIVVFDINKTISAGGSIFGQTLEQFFCDSNALDTLFARQR